MDDGSAIFHNDMLLHVSLNNRNNTLHQGICTILRILYKRHLSLYMSIMILTHKCFYW